jgi:DNA primase
MIEELENDDLVPENPLFKKIFYDVKDNLGNENFLTPGNILFTMPIPK